MSEAQATADKDKLHEDEGRSQSEDSSATGDADAPAATSDIPDIMLSKRWKKNRRRGRLHKRQLEAAEGGADVKESKVIKLSSEETNDGKSIGKEILAETDYYFENGLRKVYPYVYTYLCYCKQRWKGKTILAMLNDEFFTLSPDIHKRQIDSGEVKVNGKHVAAEYVLRGKNELISNRIHRHELPVTDQPLAVIENSDDYLVIDKPASIPVHPCGRYRHNTVLYILAKEYGINNLRIIYRLDRLTSGLLILAKSCDSTNKVMDDIKSRKAIKTYLCKVEGWFPDGTVECKEPLDRVHHKIGTWCVKKGGKESHTTFERISCSGDGKTSVVKCWPHTGRTHQIRVHLQYLGYPIVNDPLYNSDVWGPEKGKGARYHKSDQQLYDDLVASHAAHVYETGGEAVAGPEAEKDPENPSQPMDERPLHDLRLTPDPNCDWCKRQYRDPDPSQLVMYLHALSYQGTGWMYSTEMPKWVSDCQEAVAKE